MTCYKAVRINFEYWGVQGKVRLPTPGVATAIGICKGSFDFLLSRPQAEKVIRDQQRQLFHNTLRQVRLAVAHG